jgi:hypothetical protein
MSRTHLLGAVSAAALACFAPHAHAQVPTTVTGGGATSPEYIYFNELALYNSGSPKAEFLNADPQAGSGTITYWASGTTGQTAFLNNDNTCNSSKVLTGTTTCSGNTGGANSVDYAASDSPLSSTQISSWQTLPYGHAVSGGLIQIPSMGVGESFPIVNSKFTKNGQAALDDHDLCNIFTGGFTDWSQTSIAAKVAAGPITVVFRGDGSAVSYLVLNHLATVCTSALGNAPPSGVTLAPTTLFASIFPTTSGGIFTKAFMSGSTTYYTPANFQPETASAGVANYLSGLIGTPPTSAIGYITPDWTSLDPKSNATLSNGSASKLVVASLINATNNTAYTPTVANITTGLNNPASGQNLTPPTGSALSNPSAYVPVIETTKSGYPIVGYSTFDFAQCYSVANVATSIRAYLTDHYGTAAYKTIQSNNGYANLSATKASGFLTVIKNNILANKSGENLDIGDKAVCKGIGR